MSLVVVQLFLLALLLLKLFLHSRRRHKGPSIKKTQHPPSPFKLPFIGNLHQLGPLPHRSLHALSQKHGPLMLLHLGQMPVLVVSSKDSAREVMKTQDHIFANRPSLTIPRVLLYEGRGVAFAPYGEYWRQVRKVSAIHLLSAKRVQSYQSIREQEVAFMIENISQLCSHGPVNLGEALSTLAKEIISRVALGRSSRDDGWSKEISQLIQKRSRLLGAFHVGDYFPRLAWLSALTSLDARVESEFKGMDDILEAIIQEHVTRPTNEDGSEAFIDVLLSLEKDLKTQFPFNKVNIKAIIKVCL